MNEIYRVNPTEKNRRLFAFVGGLFLLSFSLAHAQDFPKEIRGYKVQRAKIAVKTKSEKTETKDKSEVSVKIGEPELIDVSLTGIKFEISAEIESLEQSGTVDFLTFQDFRVNDLKVDVEEYKESFEIKKNQTVALPKPIEIFIGTTQTLRGALKETKESKDEWTVTGRIFVFGRFKKSFLKFKRVVPIEINFKIKNPLKIREQQAVSDKQYFNSRKILNSRYKPLNLISQNSASLTARCLLMFSRLLR